MGIVVGKRYFEKDLDNLYIGSSVLLGDGDNVRDRENRQKGEPFEKPVYLAVDYLDLIESYKGFVISSNRVPNVVYEVLYDFLTGEVRGVLCGVKEESGIAYYALISPENAGAIKKHISFYIEYVNNLEELNRIAVEVEEILNGEFENYPKLAEKIYAGSFVGSTSEGLVLIPFSTYKVNEVIPAYTGEEDERIPELEMELEELNLKIAEIEDTSSEEYKQLQERKKELLRKLAGLKRKLYNPDILKAVRDTKNGAKFITRKTDIRYLGENLLQTAYLYKDITATRKGRVKGVYAVLTLPVYNNLSGRLQRGYLELFLGLYHDGKIYPAELQKARQTLSVMDEVLKELIKSAEAGTKPDLTLVKERIKDNLSLRKRVEDLEKFFLSKLGGNSEELQTVGELLKIFKEEVELGRRILYSPFTNPSLITVSDILHLLQEKGFDASNLSKENWQELYVVVETAEEQISQLLREGFGEYLPKVVEYFLSRVGKKLVYTNANGETEEYPRNGKLEIIDFQPNRVFQAFVKLILRKLKKEELLNGVGEYEIYLSGYAVSLQPIALKVITKFLISEIAKAYLERVEGNEGAVKDLKESLISAYFGNFERKQKQQTEIEIKDIPDFPIEGEEELLRQLPKENDDFDFDDFDFDDAF